MISIIIPCYKAQATIKRCLNSILAQDVDTDLEIILVNDEPSENYKEIVKNYNGLLSIKEIPSFANIGPGAARAMGVMVARGDYIMFMDSDDTLSDCFSISHLYKAMIENDANVVVSTFMEEVHQDVKNEEDVTTTQTIYVPHLKDGTWLFGKLYKMDFLRKYNLNLNGTRSNEDCGFNALVNMCNNNEDPSKIIYIEHLTYIWHFNSSSITRSTDYAFEGMRGYVENHIWAISEAIDRGLKDEVILPNIVSTMCMLYVYYISLQERPKEQLDQYIDWCRSFYFNIYLPNIKEITKEMLTEIYCSAMQTHANMVNCKISDFTLWGFIDELNIKEKGETTV
jgi:Glycosyltransferases involved in cell wall biogenesis